MSTKKADQKNMDAATETKAPMRAIPANAFNSFIKSQLQEKRLASYAEDEVVCHVY